MPSDSYKATQSKASGVTRSPNRMPAILEPQDLAPSDRELNTEASHLLVHRRDESAMLQENQTEIETPAKHSQWMQMRSKQPTKQWQHQFDWAIEPVKPLLLCINGLENQTELCESLPALKSAFNGPRGPNTYTHTETKIKKYIETYMHAYKYTQMRAHTHTDDENNQCNPPDHQGWCVLPLPRCRTNWQALPFQFCWLV